MANLYWRGGTGASGGDWNYDSNWTVSYTYPAPISSVYLIPAGRSPVAGDNVFVWNAHTLPVSSSASGFGLTLSAFSPILGNCVTGGMELADGITYWWKGSEAFGSGKTHGATATGPISHLHIANGIKVVVGTTQLDASIAYQAPGVCASDFCFGSTLSPEVSIPLYFNTALCEILHNSAGGSGGLPGISYTTMSPLHGQPHWTTINMKGVMNVPIGSTLERGANKITLSTRWSSYSPTSGATGATTEYKRTYENWGMNRIYFGGFGRIGLLKIGESWNNTTLRPYVLGSFFGDVEIKNITTANKIEIRGHPSTVNIAKGVTCESMYIKPLYDSALIVGYPSIYYPKLNILCSVGTTANQGASAGFLNSYYTNGNFKGIVTSHSNGASNASPYSVHIGNYVVGGTGQSTSAVSFYNIMEEDVYNDVSGSSEIIAEGSAFINDIVMEDGLFRIGNLSENTKDTVFIKSGEFRGYSRCYLSKVLPIGQTLGVPRVLGLNYWESGYTGAVGIKLKTNTSTFIPHPNSTISFTS